MKALIPILFVAMFLAIGCDEKKPDGKTTKIGVGPKFGSFYLLTDCFYNGLLYCNRSVKLSITHKFRGQ